MTPIDYKIKLLKQNVLLLKLNNSFFAAVATTIFELFITTKSKSSKLYRKSNVLVIEKPIYSFIS